MSRLAGIESDPRPRIVHVVPWDVLGGAETAARAMAVSEDLDCNFKVVLIAGRPILEGHPRFSGSQFNSINNPVAHLFAAYRVVREHPDVIVCSLWRSVPSALIARALLPRAKLVTFLHNTKTAHVIDRLAHAIIRRVSSAIWVDSNATLDARVKPRDRVRARVISFVLARLSPAAAGDNPPVPKFVSWGRISDAKGIDRSMRLMALLVRRGIDARYEIWGPDDGAQRHLEGLRDNLGLGSRVTFEGVIDHSKLPRLASQNSFFLQLSRREGMAMGVVEAMQLGLVPIVTPVGEIANYCRSGQNSLICNTTDLNSTATDIENLLSRPSEYERLSKNAVDKWRNSPLYANDVSAAAIDLIAR